MYFHSFHLISDLSAPRLAAQLLSSCGQVKIRAATAPPDSGAGVKQRQKRWLSVRQFAKARSIQHSIKT